MSRCYCCGSKGECEDWCGMTVSDVYEDHELTQQKLDIALETLEFYADKDKWKKNHQIMYCLVSPQDWEQFDMLKIGGKTARQAIQKIKEIE